VGAANADFGAWTAGAAITGGLLLLLGIVAGISSRRRPRATR
jgi:hypothetical protein